MLGILIQQIGPYHWARLQAATAAHRSLLAIEITAQSEEYRWARVPQGGAFSRITLCSRGTDQGCSKAEVRKKLRRVLEQYRPQVLAIPGWSHSWALAGLDWCVQTGCPAVLMSDSGPAGPGRRSRRWKNAMKHRLVALFSSALVAGSPQMQYLEQLGFPRTHCSTGYDVVDNRYFADEAQCARRDSQLLQARLGLPRRFFLTVARFIPEKNLLRLLEAYCLYRQLADARAAPLAEPWGLVLVGDGPQRGELEQRITTLRFGPWVVLPGFKQYRELPVYYGLAGAFVLPSVSETWGLAVNEAMASSLPILVSERCGCVPDLVQDGVNGFIFDPRNVSDMAAALFKISASPATRTAFGTASRQIISDWGVERFAHGLATAACTARAVGPRRADLLQWLVLRLVERVQK